MQAPVTKASRWIALLTSLSLIGVIFLPLWRIELTAPQYPEGLELKIYASKLGGNVEVVNGLNHYIGMRTLHERDFPEFAVLPYIIAALVFFGLLSFLLRKRWFFLSWVAFYLIFSVTAMIDFYRWEYNYGHNLDPTAPIQVPGMSYQPPLIGFKQLLNFGVYSMPDSGGWIFIGVALLLMLAVYKEWKSVHNSQPSLQKAAGWLFLPMLLLGGCSTAPRAIIPGQDACYFCKMSVSDLRFAGELITKKGKVFVFDDWFCMESYLKTGALSKPDISGLYLMDYGRKGEWVNMELGFLLQSEAVRGPMGGNLAAFGSADSMKKFKSEFGGNTVSAAQVLPQ